MAPFKIHVHGKATIPHEAERAIMDVEICNEGIDRKTVSEEVAKSSKELQAFLKSMSADKDASPEAKKAAALARWTMDSFNTTFHQPRDERHNSIPDAKRIYCTSVSFSVTVQDFSRMGELTNHLVTSIPHTQVHDIRWALTDETQISFSAELRKTAAKNAFQHAIDYADALGIALVKPASLKDDGLPDANTTGMSMSSARKRKMGAGPIYDEKRTFEDLVFVPEVINMTKNVECVFEAE